jgi:signal transduction histidine kinase
MHKLDGSSHEEVLAGIAHDLKTPLTAIRSFSEILLDNPGLPAGDRNRFLGIVLEESERLHRHIEHVLDTVAPFDMESRKAAVEFKP